MIPETGTREEFKEAVMKHCRYEPLVGEVYVLDGMPQIRWRIEGVDSHLVNVVHYGETICRHSLKRSQWLKMIREKALKFSGYDP